MSMNLGIRATVSADAEGFVAGMRKSAKAADDFAARTTKASRQADTAIKKTRGGAESAAKSIGTAMAGLAVVKGVHDAIKAASDLNETVSKTKVIFGEAAAGVMSFAATADRSMGLSKQAAMDAASTFGIFGKSAGLAGGDLVDFSKKMVTLSGDLASFHNTSPEDAIMAIGAAMRGESEPIRRYGVLLNDAALKQRALTMGIYDGKGALSAQERVLAAQAEILAQTSDAQGDFARTADGLANSQRILSAEWKNAQAALGQALLPAMQMLVGVLGDVLGWFNKLDPQTQRVVTTFALLAGAAIVLPKLFGAIKVAVMEVNPVLAAVTLAVGAVVAIWASHGQAAKKAKEDLEKLSAAFASTGKEMVDAASTGKPLLGLYEGLVSVLADLRGADAMDDLTTRLGRLKLSTADLGQAMIAVRQPMFQGGKATEGFRYMENVIKRLGLSAHDTSALMADLQNGQGFLRSNKSLEGFGKQAAADLQHIYEAGQDVPNVISSISNEVAREAASFGDAGKEARSSFLQQIKGVTDLNQVWAAYQTFVKSATKTPEVAKDPLLDNINAIRNAANSSATPIGQMAAAEQQLSVRNVKVIGELGDLWSSLSALDAEWQTGAKQAEAFGQALDGVSHPARAAIEGASNLAAAQEAFTKSTRKAWSKGKGKNKVSFSASVSLGSDSAQARDATNAYLALGDAMKADVARVLESTGSYDQARAAAAKYREELTSQLKALGMNTTEVEKYLSAVGMTPEQIETAIKLTGEQEAMQKLALFQGMLGPSTDPKLIAYVATEVNNGDMTKAWDALYAYFTHGTIPVNVKPRVLDRDGYRNKASGGTLSGPTMVGERGPEMVVGAGYVVNHQRLQAAARAGLGQVLASPATTGGRGGSTTIINVNAPVSVGPGGDPHQVGAVIVDVVNTYHRAGGQRFRKPTIE